MTERPINLKEFEVRGILDGRITQLVRLVKPSSGRQSKWASVETLAKCPSNYLCSVDGKLGAQFQHPLAGTKKYYGEVSKDSPYGWVKCPYGKEGDRLRGMEPWRESNKGHGDCIEYKAGGPVMGILYDLLEDWREEGGRWRSPVTMPRWACRITLDRTHTKVMRVQDMTEEDAIAAGAFYTDYGIDSYGQKEPGWSCFKNDSYRECVGTARHAIGNMWNKIHDWNAWDRNEWVWIIGVRKSQ